MAFDLSTSSGRLRAWLDMQFRDFGVVRSVYNNVYALPGGLIRLSQPSPRQIRAYQRHYGIRSVINLRGPSASGSYALEKEICAQLGLRLIDHRLFSRDMPSVEDVLSTRELFATLEYPALMHCKSGADRAGLGATLYRHFRLGEPIEQIRELHWKYGHFTLARTGILDFFLATYCARNAQQPIPFLDWVTEEYSRDELTARFESRRAMDWIIDKVLRRE